MYELQVEGMSCGHCVSRVTKAVRAVDSNAEVSVDVKNGTVRVSTSADLDEVTFVITEAGYPASKQ